MANKNGIPSVVKITKNGVTYISRVDRTKYLLSELIRAALKDCGRLIKYKLSQQMSDTKALKILTHPTNKKRKRNAFSTWVGKQEELIISARHNNWYSALQELGTSGPGGKDKGPRSIPKRGLMRETVYTSIDDIRRIQGQYLSAIEEENKALGLIDEDTDENFDEKV